MLRVSGMRAVGVCSVHMARAYGVRAVGAVGVRWVRWGVSVVSGGVQSLGCGAVCLLVSLRGGVGLVGGERTVGGVQRAAACLGSNNSCLVGLKKAVVVG